MSAPPPARSRLKTGLVRLIQALIALLVAATLLWYPPVRLSVLALTRQSSECSLSEALRGSEDLRRTQEFQDRLRAASRLVEKDPAGFQLWETPKGRFWAPDRDQAFLIHSLAEQEMKIYGAGEWGIRAGDIVLDCGAHVGTYTLAALEAGARLVVAIEPAPENLECLRRNLSSQVAAGRVVLCPKGVWDKDDSLTLYASSDDSAGDSVALRYPGSRPTTQVPLTPIDKLVAELKLERVDFIKMDIEGAEDRALLGARQTLLNFKPRLAIAAEHQRDDPERIPKVVRSLRSDYHMGCSFCQDLLTSIRPQVLCFR